MTKPIVPCDRSRRGRWVSQHQVERPARMADGQRCRQCFGLVRGDAEPTATLARPRLAYEFGQTIYREPGMTPLRQSRAAFTEAGPKVRIRFPPAGSQLRTCLSREFAFLSRQGAVFRRCGPAQRLPAGGASSLAARSERSPPRIDFAENEPEGAERRLRRRRDEISASEDRSR